MYHIDSLIATQASYYPRMLMTGKTVHGGRCGGVYMGTLLLSSQFFCKSKTVLKIKSVFKNYIPVFNVRAKTYIISNLISSLPFVKANTDILLLIPPND